MIKITKTMILFAVVAMGILSGCDKEGVKYSDYDLVDDSKAFLKVNYNVAYYNNPAVQLKINDVRVSGTNIQTRYPFPGGGFNTLGGSTGDYLPVSPGSIKISLSVPKNGTSIDSVKVYETTIQTAAGKRYSLHVTDTLQPKSLLVDEDFSLPDTSTIRYRFVNLMPNVPALDLYHGSNLIASNVAYMSSSDKFVLPTSASATSTVWSIRPAGAAASTTAIATYSSTNTFLNQRVYTVFATGYNGYKTTGTPLDVRRPFVAFYYVR